jgi:hypothetical protein
MSDFSIDCQECGFGLPVDVWGFRNLCIDCADRIERERREETECPWCGKPSKWGDPCSLACDEKQWQWEADFQREG